MLDNTCVCCGKYVPEGRQVCRSCEIEAQKMGLLNKPSVRTNGDRIRAMTDEELAEWLDLHGECNQCAYHPAQCKTECSEGHLKWLKQEVTKEDA